MLRIISFLGADGSGKSTLLTELDTDLRKTYPLKKIKLIHFRPMLKRNNSEDNTRPYCKTEHNYLISFIKLFVWCTEYTFYFFMNSMKNLFNEEIIIFDRHLLDIKIDPVRYRMNKKISELPFFKFLIPKPDLIFYIDAEPELINIRKREVSLAETESQVKSYRKSLERVKDVHTINSQQPIDECRGIIMHIVKDRFGL
jgi:thymidylate kinase